ncbi:MAG: hypothetical protein LQ343_006175 [Gyalolechia ehrenbergii]|nr:MAG: hypothetical protein LQ343_006175 [Gyalolechia ehrenbergii]
MGDLQDTYGASSPVPAAEPTPAAVSSGVLSERCYLANVDGLRPSGNDDAVAVIGIAIKFPGDASSTEAFWEMLMNRRSALSDVPKDRFNVDAFWSPDAFEPGTSNARGAHFIRENIAAFDAPFFSISPAEAECMDPQQRWLLETTYHALENAGLPLERVASTETSVHVGSFGDDYGVMLSRDPGSQAQHRATGTSQAMLANRISWFYDFTGPSIAIDTACSSSLNALDSACQCIRNGQTTMGVVAGSNIIFSPETSAALADLGFLSPDSKSYSFDHRANGYARGEGIAVVIIKSLNRAVQDHDTIRAVIRATRSNQDGRTPGVSQPSSVAHETLIRQTYTSAGLDMTLTDFFEAHGTGTRVGDPIEALGIHSAFKDRPRRYPLRIGAVKTNIGHLEGAAGLAGLIKTILVMEKGIIPPNAWFEKPNESIDSEGWNLEVSFGQAQVISCLQQPSFQSSRFPGRPIDYAELLSGFDKQVDRLQILPRVAETANPKLLVWSAQDEKGLQRLCAAYENYINNLKPMKNEACFLANLSFTLATKRTSMPWKAFLAVHSIAQMKEHLNRGLATPRRSVPNPGITFVFTGQGAEWTDEMGMDLTLQIALIALLRDWGVKPDCVVGHSSGEIAAAYCAGAISHRSALKIAYYRGLSASSLLQEGCLPGAMMAVGLSEKDVLPYLSKVAHDGKLCIACTNSSRNTTISGLEHLVNALGTLLDADGVFHRKLEVKVAYHSTAMQELAAGYSSSISEIASGSIECDTACMISSLTGQECSFQELRSPTYWARNMVSPVQFSSALRNVKSSFLKKSDGGKVGKPHLDVICEIGPHGALKGVIMDNLKEMNLAHRVNYTSLLTRGLSAENTIMEAAGVLYCTGGSIDVLKTSADFAGTAALDMLIDLPAYPFDHSKQYWSEGRLSKNTRFRKAPPHELLGTPVSDWNRYEARWVNSLGVAKSPWVTHHKINDTLLYPAAGFIIKAIEAARTLAPAGRPIIQYHLRDVTLGKAVVVPTHGSVEVQITLRQSDEATRNFLKWSEFRIYLFQGLESVEAGRGSVALEYEAEEPISNEAASNSEHLKLHRTGHVEALTDCKMAVSTKQLYDTLRNSGLTFGPSFRGLQNIRYDGKGAAAAHVNPHPWTSKLSTTLQPNIIHPGALDATLLQIILVVLTKGARTTMPTMVPTSIAYLGISSDLYDCTETTVDVTARCESVGGRSADFTTVASRCVDRKALLYCRLQAKTILDPNLSWSQIQVAPKQLCYSVEWKPDLELMTREQIEAYCSLWSMPSLDEGRLMVLEKDRLCRLAFEKVKKNIDEQAIRDRSSHLGRYLDWMNHVLSEDRYPDDPSLIEASFDKLQYQVENNDPAGKLIVRVTRNLQKILEGEIDALQLLFEDSLTNEYYRHFNEVATGFRNLGRYVDLLAHKRPDLNILEIGAGTGSATRDILRVLTQANTKRFGEYTFTDISASFFAKARDDFRDCVDRMSFLPLNIEKDPLQQGFSAKYDIIVASNVLHATSSLMDTLQMARKLLRRDGKIIIFESVNPRSITAPFIFGLLPGWWQGTEDFRKWGPLVNEDTWNSLLQATGFSGVDVSFRNSLSNGRDGSSIMIGTALDEPGKAPHNPRVVILESWLLDGRKQAKTSTLLVEELRSVLASNCGIDVQVWFEVSKLSENLKDTTFILLSGEHDTVLTDISADGYKNLQQLVKSASGLLWIIRSHRGSEADPLSETITGFLRCMQSEYERLRVASLRISPTTSASDTVKTILKVFRQNFMSSVDNPESEYLVDPPLIQIPRVVDANHLDRFVYSKVTTANAEPRPFGDTPSRCLKLNVAKPEVKATGVNFLDVLIALGQVPSDHIGRDCAGVITQAGSDSSLNVGDRVVCNTIGAYRTRARCKAAVACRIPNDISFTIAAALPTPFLTAYYALVEVARLRPHETVLIHSAAGGTGQACVQIAQLYSAEIYATVGAEEKRELLRETYGIPDDHIFTSRSPAFTSGISAMTKGRGVDVVINSLAGEALRNTWEQCLAPLGRFIEIGKKDIMSLGQLPMSTFAKNVTFASVDLMMHLRETPAFVGSLLNRVVDLLVDGKISVQKPLAIFDASRIEEAFRLMQSGKNKGKMVIEFGSQDLVPVRPLDPKSRNMSSTLTAGAHKTVPSNLPTYEFDANASYVIVGGLGGLGRSVARWMASLKARHLILLGSSNPIREAGKVLVEELQAQGVSIATPPCDVSDKAALERIINHCRETMPPIKGCIQGAMVLRDSSFANMSYENFHTVLRPKVQGSWNLHSLLPKNMDFFILLSSYAGIIGSYGQTNYAAGNTYQDALAQYRVSHGEKAVSIDLANVRSVGYLAERDELAAALRTEDRIGIEEAEFLALMEHCCDPALELSTENCQIVTGVETAASLRSRNLTEPLYMNRAFFSYLYALDDGSVSAAAADDDGSGYGRNNYNKSNKNANPESNYHHLLSTTDGPEEAGSIITEGLSKKLSAMMDLDIQNIDISQPLHRFGVDSLAAIEIRTWLARAIRADLAIFDIIGNTSIEELGRLAAEKSEFVTYMKMEGDQGKLG